MKLMLHFGNNYNTGCFTYNWQVWDYTGLGYTRYNARDVGKEYLGYALIKAVIIFYLLIFFVSGHIFLFVFVLLRCVVENKVLCNSLLLRLQVCLFFNF
jgi:ubiquinone biosynthesis monooxygenase Coq6